MRRMKGLFMPEITAEMFRNGCLESIETLMSEGEIYDIEYSPWIPVSERLPEEKINPFTNDFESVLCSTVSGAVRPYKYGKPIGYDKPHFFLCGQIMDEYITAWQPLPEPYKEGGEKE